MKPQKIRRKPRGEFERLYGAGQWLKPELVPAGTGKRRTLDLVAAAKIEALKRKYLVGSRSQRAGYRRIWPGKLERIVGEPQISQGKIRIPVMTTDYITWLYTSESPYAKTFLRRRGPKKAFERIPHAMGAAAIVITKDGKIVLTKRADSSIVKANTWDNPGGIVEKGEKLQEVAKKRIEAELGIKATEIEFLGKGLARAENQGDPPLLVLHFWSGMSDFNPIYVVRTSLTEAQIRRRAEIASGKNLVTGLRFVINNPHILQQELIRGKRKFSTTFANLMGAYIKELRKSMGEKK